MWKWTKKALDEEIEKSAEPTPVTKRNGIEVTVEDATMLAKLQDARKLYAAFTEEEKLAYDISIFFREATHILDQLISSQTARDTIRKMIAEARRRTATPTTTFEGPPKNVGEVLLTAIETMCDMIDGYYEEKKTDTKGYN